MNQTNLLTILHQEVFGAGHPSVPELETGLICLHLADGQLRESDASSFTGSHPILCLHQAPMCAGDFPFWLGPFQLPQTSDTNCRYLNCCSPYHKDREVRSRDHIRAHRPDGRAGTGPNHLGLHSVIVNNYAIGVDWTETRRNQIPGV